MVSRWTQLLLGALALCVAVQFYRLGHLHNRLGEYNYAGLKTQAGAVDALASLHQIVSQVQVLAARSEQEQIKALEQGPATGTWTQGPPKSSLAEARHLSQLAGEASRLLSAINVALVTGATDGADGTSARHTSAGGPAGACGGLGGVPGAAEAEGGTAAYGGGTQPARRRSASTARGSSREDQLRERIRALQLAQGVAQVTDDEAVAHSVDIDAVAARASHGLRNVLVTYANIHSKELTLNWLWHVVALNVSNFLLLAMDEPMRDLCVSLGVPVYLMEMSRGDEANTALLAHVAEKDKAHLTQYDLLRLDHNAFRRMGMLKCDILLQLLTTGHDVLFSDTDTVWMRNPWPYLDSTSPTANILVSTDCLSHVRDEGLVLPPDAVMWDRCGHVEGRWFGTAINTGMLFVRSSHETRQFVARWKLRIAEGMGEDTHVPDPIDDQMALNQLVAAGMYPIRPYPEDPRVFPAGGEQDPTDASKLIMKLRLGTLPTVEFANGHVFFLQRLHQRHDFLPYVVHVTFTNGGMAGKINRLREAHLWQVDEDSYYTDGLFVHAHIPQHLDVLGDGNATVDTHMLVVRQQLAGIRNALAIARALNRTLIMPRTSCHCSRDCPRCQVLPACRIMGSDVRPPFQCPLDELFDIAHLVSLNVSFRESSFLENWRTPEDVRTSRVVLMTRPAATLGEMRAARPELFEGAAAHYGDSVIIPEYPTDRQLQAALARYRHTRVVEIVDATKSFCHFEAVEDNRQLDELWASIASRGETDYWCCKPQDEDFMMHYKQPDPLLQRVYKHCE
eukprot:jgi/Mesvir1/29520/Mv07018-RA.1